MLGLLDAGDVRQESPNSELRQAVNRAASGRCGRVRSLGFVLALPSIAFMVSGCGVKTTVQVPVPVAIREAKTASLDDLIGLLGKQSAAVESLSTASLRVTFTSGRVDSGKLQAYRSAPGYLLLKRADRLRLNVQNPITKTTIVELASVDDTFSVWLPRDNRLYEGRNSAGEFELDSGPSFTAKPIHILEAILPPVLPLNSTGIRISLKEERDAANKYYVVSLYRDAAQNRLEPIRDIWVERANLTIARQQFFDPGGEVISNVGYSGWENMGAVRMPLRVVIERPGDGYSLDLQFRSWNINPELPDSAFLLQPPQDAERVLLKEKRESR
jgi:hypothetical protein